MDQSELEARVLACANKVAGTRLTLAPGEDLPLEAFHLDSLSLFAFMVELESACGISFDDAMLHPESLQSIRSAAAWIVSRHSGPAAG